MNSKIIPQSASSSTLSVVPQMGLFSGTRMATRNSNAAESSELASRVTSRVLQGDAFDLIPTLKTDSVDLVITSPPYWGHRTYEGIHDWNLLKKWREPAQIPSYDWYRSNGGLLGLEPYPDWYVSHLVEILGLVRSCLKKAGSLWINLGDTYFARWSSIRSQGRQGLGNTSRIRRRTPMGGYRQEKQLLLIPARFAIAMQNDRWILRNDLIWSKPNVPPRPEADRLKLAHEHFFHFVLRPTQGRAKYYYDISAAEPRATDVVTYNVRPGEGGHTATFPVGLIRPRIESSCPPGGTILDPFCGTGRALTTAKALGREGTGIELSERFCATARRALG